MSAIETPWWCRCDELSALYLYLIDTDRLDPSDHREVAYMLQKPWKYDDEHGEMIARRTANDADDPDDLSDALEASVVHVRSSRRARAVAR